MNSRIIFRNNIRVRMSDLRKGDSFTIFEDETALEENVFQEFVALEDPQCDNGVWGVKVEWRKDV